MPLIYNGQEAGLRHRLAFFEKDEIRWRPHRFEQLYRRLTVWKRSLDPLAHGASRPFVRGRRETKSTIRFLRCEDPGVLAFVRESESAALLAVFRLEGSGPVRMRPRLRVPMVLQMGKLRRGGSRAPRRLDPRDSVDFDLGRFGYAIWMDESSGRKASATD